jgi:hypothetical protein
LQFQFILLEGSMSYVYSTGMFLESTDRDLSINIGHIIRVDNVDGVAAIRLARAEKPRSPGDSRIYFGPFSDVAQALQDQPVNGLLLIDEVRFDGLTRQDCGQIDEDGPARIVGQSIINFRHVDMMYPYERVDGVFLSAPEGGNRYAGISISKIDYKTLQILRDQSLATNGLLVAPSRNEQGYATAGAVRNHRNRAASPKLPGLEIS